MPLKGGFARFSVRSSWLFSAADCVSEMMTLFSEYYARSGSLLQLFAAVSICYFDPIFGSKLNLDSLFGGGAFKYSSRFFLLNYMMHLKCTEVSF